MEVLVDLYFLVLSEEYLKVILITIFGELSIPHFNFKINIFADFYKKHDV